MWLVQTADITYFTTSLITSAEDGGSQFLQNVGTEIQDCPMS